ncbi:hypothetical protein HRH09_13140 [Enterococcus faecalis]|nr:hypothetical protein [Enterococcus faecalis]
MKTSIEGSHGLLIKKYSSDNIIVFSGRTGSGKTYQIEKNIELDSSKKLLLASVGDCKYEYLNANNMTRISYYDTLYEYSVQERFVQLFDILEAQVKEMYDLIIIDNVSFTTYKQISNLFSLCLLYPDTKFFITLDEKIELNEEKEEISQLFLKNDGL